MTNQTTFRFGFLVAGLAALLLAGCASDDATTSSSKKSSAKGATTYKVGQPYQIEGQWYYPREDYSYDQTGTASWYGPDFHGGVTANGEIYNQNELTAAHPTLPMPSLVRVSNLENGRSVVVRINDRGPFKDGRIIDVSERAADLLGFKGQGTTRVRVQILPQESKALAQRAMQDSFGYQMASYQQPNVRMSAVSTPMVETQPLPEPAYAPTKMADASASSANMPAISPETIQFARQPPPSDMQETHLPPVVAEPSLARAPAAAMPEPAYAAPSTASSNIYVQAGAFSSRENAMSLQNRLQNIARVELSPMQQSNGQTLYRVRLGPLKSATQADRVFQEVRQAGVSSPRIVAD
ncbi:MAG: septal ring lytic transglycosylase RlpA family protein [Alphaproteobacteria bacterium]|nr:septal ring lytic transglycosylase RlpA family protein [Alphaproteobacteria bacterium]NDG05382.1 septal ring lytic transglycosylase RlpA family protein [Alphaproteobacteria bacterium]